MTAMFPLQSALLPGETLPLRIFEPRYSRLVADCLAADDPAFGVVLIQRGAEVGGGDTRADVGSLARITHCLDLGAGQYQLLAAMGERIRVRRWLPDEPYPQAEIEPWPDEPGAPVTPERIGEVIDRILALFEKVAEAGGGRLPADVLAVDAETADDPARHVYALAARVPMGPADRYALLCAPTLSDRVDALLDAVDNVTAMVEFGLSED